MNPKDDIKNYCTIGEAVEILGLPKRQHLDWYISKHQVHYMWISVDHSSRVRLIYKPDIYNS